MITDYKEDGKIAISIMQNRILSWAVATFGSVATVPSERAMRVVEEAVELAQAAGIDRRVVDRIISRVYQRPIGDPATEVGGLAVTVLAYCESIGLNAWVEVCHEMKRVEALPAAHWKARHDAKIEAGTAMGDDHA